MVEKLFIDLFVVNFSLLDFVGWVYDNVFDWMCLGFDVLWDGIFYVNWVFDMYNLLVSQYVMFLLIELVVIFGQFGS